MKLLQIKLHDDTHKKFKKLCLEEDVTMADKIRFWINKYMKSIDKKE